MSNVYPIDSQKNLIIYSFGKNIHLRISAGDNIERPIILANDYHSNLFETIHNNTLHYAYHNSDRDIIIKNILDTSVLFQLSQLDIPDCTLAGIKSFNNQLLLFYFVENPLDGTYTLKCISLFNKQDNINIPKIYKVLPTTNIIATQNYVYILSDCNNNSEDSPIWMINKDFSLDKYSTAPDIQQLEKEISSRYTYELERKNAFIRKQNDIIESAKLQYNELMSVASKYRDEALKWRSKFYKD